MIFNRTVVHGVFLVLAVIEGIAASRPGTWEISDLLALFRGPVASGDTAELKFEGDWPQFRFSVICRRSVVTSGSMAFREVAKKCKAILPNLEEGLLRDPSDEEIAVSASQERLSSIEGLEKLFPAACQALPNTQLSALLTLTRIVGMRCPGRHSLLSELRVSFDESMGTDRLNWNVRNYDRRFSRVEMSVTGSGTKAEIAAFVVPSTHRERTAGKLAGLVGPTEFRGRRALVIGGSRGLGAALVRFLALGGAEITATYKSGAADAAVITEDLKSCGVEVRFDQLDLDEGIPPFWKLGGGFTDLFFLATPSIFTGAKGVIAPELFDGFNRVFIDGFLDVLTWAKENCSDLRYVFYPSSTVLDRPQSNLVEYAMSKIAAEEMIRALAVRYHQINFDVVRLPRLATDQTINLAGVSGLDAATAALRILRRQNL